MIVELGHFALVLAFAVAVYQTIIPLYGAARGSQRLMNVAGAAALTQFFLVAAAFGALIWAYVSSDFSVENVWANSHTAKPLLYKVTGVWSNHEGSMLLWVSILAFFGALIALFSANLPQSLKARVLGVQGSISVGFLLYIVTVSNPFVRIPPDQVPMQGRGFNPILQDPALAFHPPLLYSGYVGFSVAFSFAIAALMEGKVDAAWARWVRPWTLAAWTFLTLGIALGSWWAYYELGWGGWWFWDPVENASLMPWLAGTALLHSAIVVEKRNTLKIWTILLAIIAFSLSLIGTFLVRSGVLSSVHAFAVDPQRGVFILMILLFFIGGSFILYAARAGSLKTGGLFAPISREGALVVNNLLMSASAAAVFIGTLFPLAYEAMTNGGKITVGAPYFNLTFGLLMIPLLLLIPVGPMLSWKRADLFAALGKLIPAAAIALVVAIATVAMHSGRFVMAALGLALGVWIVAGALVELAGRIRLFRAPVSVSLRRLWNIPGQALGMALAHLGMGLVVLGIIASSTWKEEVITSINIGDSVKAGGYEVRFMSERQDKGPDYIAQQAWFDIFKGGRKAGQVFSEKRAFIPRGMPTTEVGLVHYPGGDLYVAIGDRDSKGRVVRVYFQPFIYLMWIGALFMAFGGVVSLLDRRFRVGVAQKAAARLAAEGAKS